MNNGAIDPVLDQRDLPTCFVCRKKSDGAKMIDDIKIHVCGTHFDEWLRSHERRRFEETRNEVHVTDFMNRVQAEWRNGE